MKTPPRILVVEDEKLIAFDLSRRLPRLGYVICGMAATGLEAIAKAKELAPDLILMDICLQGAMDGVQAAEEIRKVANLPVIFLTANADEATLQRAKHTLPSSYVLKPFKERELQITIDLALVNHSLQVELHASRRDLELKVIERTKELEATNVALILEVQTRKAKEAEARDQANILSQARDAIYVRDLSGIVAYWNHGAERLYGIDESTALQSPIAALFAEGDPEVCAEAGRLTLLNGEWTGELRHTTGGGAEVVVESRWTLVRDDQGEPRGILVVNTDITEKKKGAEQLMRTQRLESVGALASGIAHDLNNVFTPMLMAAELLQEAPDQDRASMIEIVSVAAKRGAEMVKQLLMFVRGGESELEPVTVDALVAEVGKLMKETLPCTIQVKTSSPEAAQLVLGDATQLHQMLINLCVNARDAMPDGGELGLILENVEFHDVRLGDLGELRPGQYLRITVSDTGTGMSPEVRSRIFEPFFTTKDIGVGTGLGLSTVAAIVQRHQGAMDVETQLGLGTRFIIYLPVCAQPGARLEQKPDNSSKGNGELLIVVDDDHAVREVTKLTLESRNYRVLLADDGAEALSVYLQHREQTALVITDIMMPVMHGRALIHALRRLSPDLPIIAFTAGERNNPLIGSLEDSSVAMLFKPATPNRLLTAVAEALNSANPTRHPFAPVQADALAHI